MNSILVLLFIAVLPSIILGLIVYKKDKIEKESVGLIIKLFLGGIASTVTTILITIVFEIFFPFLRDPAGIILIFLYSFIKVALIEESNKFYFLKIFTWNNKEFNHIYDAIVYSSFVSLGFATLENVLYVFSTGFITGIVRAIVSVPGHVFFAIFMGYFYGLSKQAEYNGNTFLKKRNMYLSILVPVLLHGFFDFCLLSGSIILVIIFVIFVIFLYVRAFRLLSRISKVQRNLIDNEANNNYDNFSNNLVDTVNNKRYCHNCGFLLRGEYCHNCGTKRIGS